MNEKICGIYAIKNIRNRCVYIGSTRDISRRFYAHVQALKHGKHSSDGLQADFNAGDEFQFSIVMRLPDSSTPREIAFYERRYIVAFQSRTIYGCGYNDKLPSAMFSLPEIKEDWNGLWYKFDILEAVESTGASVCSLLGRNEYSNMRDGYIVRNTSIRKVCEVLGCERSDLIEPYPDIFPEECYKTFSIRGIIDIRKRTARR